MRAQSLQTPECEVLTYAPLSVWPCFTPAHIRLAVTTVTGLGAYFITQNKSELNPSRIRNQRGEIRSAQRSKAIGDAQQKNQSDPAAVHRSGPRNHMIEARMVTAGIKCSADRSRHQRIHGDKPERKRSQPEHSAGGAAEIGRQEEERELAWRLGADAVQNADYKHRLAGIHPLKALGPRCRRIPDPAYTPRHPQHAVDGNGEPALDAAVPMTVGVLAQNAGYNAQPQHNQRQADQAFGPVIQSLRQSHVQLQHCDTKGGDGERVTEGVRHSKAQAALPVPLDSR